MSLKIDLKDEFSPYVKFILATKPEWVSKIMKSLGWQIQQETKKGIKEGSPGGERFSPFSPINLRSKMRKKPGRASKTPLGKLVNAIGYEFKSIEQAVNVGWLSQSAASLGWKAEKGSTQQVTDKMRRKYSALGIPVKDKIKRPARPIWEPTIKFMQPRIASHFENQINKYLIDDVPKSSVAQSKKYRVFG